MRNLVKVEIHSLLFWGFLPSVRHFCPASRWRGKACAQQVSRYEMLRFMYWKWGGVSQKCCVHQCRLLADHTETISREFWVVCEAWWVIYLHWSEVGSAMHVHILFSSYCATSVDGFWIDPDMLEIDCHISNILRIIGFHFFFKFCWTLISTMQTNSNKYAD